MLSALLAVVSAERSPRVAVAGIGRCVARAAAECAYCPLYDAGYTSIGGVHNTLPNAALAAADGSYAPAYKLVDGSQERSGRTNLAKAAESSPGQRGLRRTNSSGRLVAVPRGTVRPLSPPLTPPPPPPPMRKPCPRCKLITRISGGRLRAWGRHW